MVNHVYPTADTPVQTVGFSEFCEINGRQFKRRKGTESWTEITTDSLPSAATAPSSPLLLSLVHHTQSPGEPIHWQLLVARENQPGSVYEVTGDAECMSYQPSTEPVDVTKEESFSTAFHLATLLDEQATKVKEIAERETPPSAPNRLAVRETCQGWAVRVIARLVDEGIVEKGKLNMAKGMVEPIR